MSFRSSAQAEDFDLLARMDVRYMLGSRFNQASWEVRSGSNSEVAALPRYFCFVPMNGHRETQRPSPFCARLIHRRDHVLTLPSGAAADSVLTLDANHVITITNTQHPAPEPDVCGLGRVTVMPPSWHARISGLLKYRA